MISDMENFELKMTPASKAQSNRKISLKSDASVKDQYFLRFFGTFGKSIKNAESL